MARVDPQEASSPAGADKASGAAPVLVLALGRAGFGEAALGRRVAADLASLGHPVHFLIHPAIARAFEGADGEVELLGDERDALLDARLTALVRRARPGAILLADLLMAITELERRAAGPRVLSRFDLPIVALDPWNLPEIGGVMDMAPGAALPIAASAIDHPLRLVPVPFARPSAAGGAQLLPRRPPPSPSARAAARTALGLGPSDKLILTATARWQQRRYGVERVDRAVLGVPRLVGAYRAAMGERLRVLHVGPAPLPWAEPLGARYRHEQALPPEEFEARMIAADLLLSLNAPATTSTAAVAHGVPVLTLQNSFVGETLDALWSWLGERPAPAVVQWARVNTPLYRFLMWPMSGWQMLSRVLADNPYDRLLNRVELLDARRVLETMHSLLERGEDEAARAAYLDEVRALPSPGGLVRRLTGIGG